MSYRLKAYSVALFQDSHVRNLDDSDLGQSTMRDDGGVGQQHSLYDKTNCSLQAARSATKGLKREGCGREPAKRRQWHRTGSGVHIIDDVVSDQSQSLYPHM